MSKIHISKEVFEKIKNSQCNSETSILLSKFNPNRPEPRTKDKKAKNENRDNDEKTINQSRNELSQALHNFRKKHNMPQPEDPKKAAARKRRVDKKLARIKLEKRKLERVRKISEQSKNESHFSIYSTGLSNVKSANRKNVKIKSKPIYDSRGNDAYNFAGEYSARNIEYGHGRHKTDEWNDTTAYSFNKELGRLKKTQREDPNTFDRGAMK